MKTKLTLRIIEEALEPDECGDQDCNVFEQSVTGENPQLAILLDKYLMALNGLYDFSVVQRIVALTALLAGSLNENYPESCAAYHAKEWNKFAEAAHEFMCVIEKNRLVKPAAKATR